MKIFRLLMIVVLLLSVPVANSGTKEILSEDKLEEANKFIEILKPLHKKPGPPGPYDWLSVQPEPGQTFLQYTKADPVRPTLKRNIIYLQLIGEFTDTQKKILKLTAEFVELFYQMPVQMKDPIPLSVIPDKARRVHPVWKEKQILSTYIIEEVLIPKLPDDAVACLAFTANDLWPGPGWNFVFGQASPIDRVGVWSIYRNGDPDKSADDFKICLLRTIKTAVHEIGHMFSIMHCIHYECLMAGSNYRVEADRRPLALCPECVAKLYWIGDFNLIQRYQKLESFCRREELVPQADFYQKSIKILEQKK